jgi:hypothetical protein
MAEVSLSDQYVLLLNDVIKENKAVREKLEQTSESSSESATVDQSRALKDLANKVDSLNTKIWKACSANWWCQTTSAKNVQCKYISMYSMLSNFRTVKCFHTIFCDLTLSQPAIFFHDKRHFD